MKPLAVEDLALSAAGRGTWLRNIVSLRQTVDLFSSLVDTSEESRVLSQHEMATKPYRSSPTIIHRPFEFAATYDAVANAIQWPFEHPARSRFSTGGFGVWYGASDLEATIYETGFHFWKDSNASEATAGENLVQYRRVHQVECSRPLLDLRPQVKTHPRRYDGDSYDECQRLGAEASRDRLPGFITFPARDPRGERGRVAAVLDESALHSPRDHCYLTYRLDPSGLLRVYRGSRKVLLSFRPGKTI